MSSKGSCVEDFGAQLMESMKDDWIINVLTYQQIILLCIECIDEWNIRKWGLMRSQSLIVILVGVDCMYSL